MKTGLRRHLTPGNAVAMAALVVALGGTAVAQVAIPNGAVTTAKLANGSVTSAKLKNGSVTTDKITNSAVTSAQIAAATITAANIAPGVLGGLSASKVSTVRGDQVTVTGSSRMAIAICPAGQMAISGGYNLGPFPVILEATGPVQNPQGWSVTASQQGVVPGVITATAVCVAP